MGKCLIFVLIGIAFVFLFIKERLKGPSARGLIMKAMASMCFIMTAAFGIVVNHAAFLYGAVLLIGLVFGLLGDILLDLKYLCPNDSRRYTVAGFLIFAAGHFFYMTAMIRSFKPGIILTLSAAFLAAAAGFANGTVGQSYLKVKYGEYQPVTILYSFFAAGSFFTALACIAAGGYKYGGPWMMLGGSLLLAVSDLILARTYFGKRHDKPVDIITNHAMYYAAQFLIALSVAGMK